MFFDGFNIYLADGVLAATTQSSFSTLPQSLHSSRSLGRHDDRRIRHRFLGDRFDQRFTYQFNLLVFRLASLAAAFART